MAFTVLEKKKIKIKHLYFEMNFFRRAFCNLQSVCRDSGAGICSIFDEKELKVLQE